MSVLLSNSPAELLRELMILFGNGASVASGSDWPIYVGNEPQTPDECITLYNTQGRDLARIQFDGSRAEYHGIQVRVRSRTELRGVHKAREICHTLDEEIILNTVTLTNPISGLSNQFTVYSVMRTSDVLPLGKQVPSNKLDLFTINGLISLRQDTDN